MAPSERTTAAGRAPEAATARRPQHPRPPHPRLASEQLRVITLQPSDDERFSGQGTTDGDPREPPKLPQAEAPLGVAILRNW